MCGIVGYVGPKDARDVVLEGLRRLEYRGYDSAGIAVVADGKLSSAKKAGKLANLEKVLADSPLPAATIGIGHTRWATHGGADRPQRPPAPVRRRLGGRDPQRDHRELRRPARRVRAQRRRVHLRDRHRGGRAPARRRLRRGPRGRGPAGRGDAGGLPPPRGRVHPRRDRRRRARHPGRRAAQQPARGGRRRRASTSSGPTSPRSSRTPARPASSARTRSWRSTAPAG